MSLVNLRPRLHQTRLFRGDGSRQLHNGLDSVHGRQALKIGMEMGAMMRFPRLGKHPNDDSIEPADLRQRAHSSFMIELDFARKDAA